MLLSLLALWLGCAPALAPRHAELVPAGRLGGTVDTTFAARTAAETTLATARGPQVATGSAGAALPPDLPTPGDAIAFGYGAHVQSGLRVGLPGAELGLIYGFTRIGAELRLGLLQEARGAPLSVAPAVAGAFMPWEGGGVWGRVGVDVSRRFADRDAMRLVPHLGAHLSHGPQRYTHRIGRDWGYWHPPCDLGLRGPCGRRRFAVVSAEATTTRLSVPVGLSIVERDSGFTFGLGGVGHADLASRVSAVDCAGCRRPIEARAFRERFGAAAMVSVGVTPPPRSP